MVQSERHPCGGKNCAEQDIWLNHFDLQKNVPARGSQIDGMCPSTSATTVEGNEAVHCDTSHDVLEVSLAEPELAHLVARLNE
jgi:hypothetical protein